MAFMHPIFTLITLLLIAYSFQELRGSKNLGFLGSIVAVIIALIGLRNWVGADYPIYLKYYELYGRDLPYAEITASVLFGGNLPLEWLYVVFGKFFYLSQLPFYIFTLFIAILSIWPKYRTYTENVAYPSLAILLYMFPSLFTSDGGHMRQAVAMGIVLYSFTFIKKRNLFWFLFTIFIAMGFHKTSIIFIPAYWLVVLPMSSKRIAVIILFCVLISPLEVYRYIALLESIAPEEIYEGFDSFQQNQQEGGAIKINDLVCIWYSYFLITYNKVACEKIPYYEYMRNIGVVGVCFYFIFRGNPIFSSRLVVYYFVYMTMVIPNIIFSIRNNSVRTTMHLFVLAFVVFYYFVYAIMQAPRALYNIDYSNYLWSS